MLSEEEVQWIDFRELSGQHNVRWDKLPAKVVRLLLEKIETGDFKPILVDFDRRIVHTPINLRLFEAYGRARMTYVPVKEGEENVKSDPEQEE